MFIRASEGCQIGSCMTAGVETGLHILPRLLSNCVSLDKSLNLSEAQFSYIYNGDRNNLCLAHTLFKLQDEIRNLCKSTWKANIFFSMLETE